MFYAVAKFQFLPLTMPLIVACSADDSAFHADALNVIVCAVWFVKSANQFATFKIDW